MIAVDRQRKVVAPAGSPRPPDGRPRGPGALEPRPAAGPLRGRRRSTWRWPAGTEFDALGVLAAACQSRRTTAGRLLAAGGVPGAGGPAGLAERRAPRRGAGDLLGARARLPPPRRACARAAQGRAPASRTMPPSGWSTAMPTTAGWSSSSTAGCSTTRPSSGTWTSSVTWTWRWRGGLLRGSHGARSSAVRAPRRARSARCSRGTGGGAALAGAARSADSHAGLGVRRQALTAAPVNSALCGRSGAPAHRIYRT